MYPSVVDDNGPSRPVWLTLQQILLLVCEGLPGAPLTRSTVWQTHHQGCRNSIPTAPRCYCLSANTPADSAEFSDETPNLRERREKKNSLGEMPLWQIFFCVCGLTECLFARPPIWRGCIEGPSVERKWHKSRVKLNVLTVSRPLWPCSAPPLSPVWLHHSSSEWGLLAQHLCQTTATLASAPASLWFCRSAPPGPQAWLITHIIRDRTVAGEQSAHFTTSGASVHYSAQAASSLVPDQIHDKWSSVDRFQEDPSQRLHLHVMSQLMAK